MVIVQKYSVGGLSLLFVWTMVCRCVAAGCSKTHRDGVSLFGFPKDITWRKKWADQVRRTRDKWEPTSYSVLCNLHFEDWCFEQDSKLTESIGKKRPRLKPDAVPTIFEKPASLKRKNPTAAPQVQKKMRSALKNVRDVG